MDKITPKPHGFKLNRGCVAPLLQKLNADGIGHMIDGQRMPSISGATF
jgi:5-carboxymethyl-2-hydroxymuconic-semialdehyde dehydrogenase